jgi:hypothetical protein
MTTFPLNPTEAHMPYKTIVLHLLEQRPRLYERLRRGRLLLPALDRHAAELKASHEAWKDRLARTKPGSDEMQIAGEALEIALRELEQDHLPPESSTDAG